MSLDDIFDQVQAPRWAESLAHQNQDFEEDDSFFPDSDNPIEDITCQIAQMTVENLTTISDTIIQPTSFPVNEDAEDLSRMAMFGKKAPVKRRSQIKKEQEAGSKETLVVNIPSLPPVRASSIPRPSSRASSLKRTSSITGESTGESNIDILRSGPITRSQTRAMANAVPKAPVERPSRDMARNSASNRRSIKAPSPIPTQDDFNDALRQRASSLGKVPQKTASQLRPRLTVSKLTQSRPVTVTKSPKMAFGSVVKEPSTNAKSIVPRPTQPPLRGKHVPVRVLSSTGQTPIRPPLTIPKTPTVAKRSSSISRAVTPVKKTTKTVETKALNTRDIQGMIDRLSKPKAVSSITRPSTLQTNKKIPNTYTHGITTTMKVRSRSNSRPPSQMGKENTAAVQ